MLWVVRGEGLKVLDPEVQGVGEIAPERQILIRRQTLRQTACMQACTHAQTATAYKKPGNPHMALIPESSYLKHPRAICCLVVWCFLEDCKMLPSVTVSSYPNCTQTPTRARHKSLSFATCISSSSSLSLSLSFSLSLSLSLSLCLSLFLSATHPLHHSNEQKSLLAQRSTCFFWHPFTAEACP